MVGESETTMTSTIRKRLQSAAERVNPVNSVHYWGTPPGAGVEIHLITRLDVYSTMYAASVEALPNETGGFLLGHVASDPVRRSWHVEIDEILPIEATEQDPVHFSFTWRDVDRVRTHREAQGKALIGWYHTHPDLGIFLSPTDLEKTHRVLFAEPFQVALVYDPVRQRAGYFFWEGQQVIDPSPASWREFALAIGPEAPSEPAGPAEPAAGSIEPAPSPAPTLAEAETPGQETR
jgi:proteasome lid subunit RPN8/RPN11